MIQLRKAKTRHNGEIWFTDKTCPFKPIEQLCGTWCPLCETFRDTTKDVVTGISMYCGGEKITHPVLLDQEEAEEEKKVRLMLAELDCTPEDLPLLPSNQYHQLTYKISEETALSYDRVQEILELIKPAEKEPEN